MTFPEFTIENAIEKLENDGIARKTKGFAAICVGATLFDLARENESSNRKSVKNYEKCVHKYVKKHAHGV